MSVAVLKADDELGYWEYSVLTDDGEWNIQFSRTEKAGPEHTDEPNLYRLHMNITREGGRFFNSWEYEEKYPFLTEYSMNGLVAAAGVASLAYWYQASAQYRSTQNLGDLLRSVLGDQIEINTAIINADTGQPIDVNDPRQDDKFYMKADDCERIGPEDKTTHALYMELHHYGMATTTPEYRERTFGKADLEPAWWGQRGDCDHEHE